MIEYENLGKLNKPIFEAYKETFDRTLEFIKPAVDENYYEVYHIFNIRYYKRDRVKGYLLKHDVKTEIHFPIAPHKQKAMN